MSMKRILFVIEDNNLKIDSQMFYIYDYEKNIKKIKEVERILSGISACSWHNFHHRFLNWIAIKKLFGRREND